ncbi:MAG: 16S rRNA (cytosine(967)-C(5))-methyltransferase RsmB [Candidatus Accumulibacter sp.]|nr:16S rRNA (cytosine(967)-C(5))-methyltransferase RsmB [Accumulibacter sp.]
MAPDSLACSLSLSARVVAAVRAGRSLTQALTAVGDQPPATRAAVQEISYGTLRGYGQGEFILGRLLDRSLANPEGEALLLVALYRLRSRPEATHTVVDQAVSAASELAGGAYKGLVNGVLRNYLRQRTALDAAIVDDEVACHQHPRWWLNRLRRAYPADWPAIVAADNAPPPMTLRVNRRRVAPAEYMARLSADGLSCRALGGVALRLDKPVAVERLPGFAEGWVSVQDAGAQQAAEWLRPVDGQRLLDACAAPGGKSAHLLEMANVDLTAIDIDQTRARRITDNLRRLGLSASVRVADCREGDSWWNGVPFDAILADVPCSASGVVRRHPDAKYLRRESDVRRFASLQSEILDRLWPLLTAGGRLLYATCSLFPEENGAQIDAFLHRHPDARRQRGQQLLPGAEHDGFFYALLEKTP